MSSLWFFLMSFFISQQGNNICREQKRYSHHFNTSVSRYLKGFAFPFYTDFNLRYAMQIITHTYA